MRLYILVLRHLARYSALPLTLLDATKHHYTKTDNSRVVPTKIQDHSQFQPHPLNPSNQANSDPHPYHPSHQVNQGHPDL